MPDEEVIGGPGAGRDLGAEDGGEQSVQSLAEQGSREAAEGQSEREEEGGGGRGQSNLGDWDPAQQGGGGGELY